MEYDYVGISDRGITLAKDGRQWLSYPIGYDAEGEIQNAFSEYEICGACGILNRITGKPLTLAIYESVCMLSENVFEVRDADTFESYLIDACGNRCLL